jgi:four helix bundle protein
MGRITTDELKQRTIGFALEVIKLCSGLKRTYASDVIARQLLRSGTSVGAHYHEACRARSAAEFISKIEGGQQELEESMYWLTLMNQAGLTTIENTAPIITEAEELMAIFSASVTTIKSRKTDSRPKE